MIPSEQCIRDSVQYYEGDFVPSSDKCTDCHCLHGSIVCFILECPGVDERCTILEKPEGSCCPSKYECRKYYIIDIKH